MRFRRKFVEIVGLFWGIFSAIIFENVKSLDKFRNVIQIFWKTPNFHHSIDTRNIFEIYSKISIRFGEICNCYIKYFKITVKVLEIF